MDNLELIEHQWPYLLKMLGGGAELERSAIQFGALQRRRGIKDAETLLRLALIYAFCGCSLRQTAVYAELGKIASLSNVAVFKRLRAAKEWLGYLVASKLSERAAAVLPDRQLRLRLLDASTVNRPGTQGTDLRLHVGFNLKTLSMDQIELTDSSEGESLQRFDYAPNDLAIGDRGYAHAAGIHALAKASAYFIVRINWQFPLYSAEGSRVDILELLRRLPEAEAGEFPVTVRYKEARIPCRLVAIRKTEQAAAVSRDKVIRVARKKGRSVIDPRTLESNGYAFVLTNLPSETISAADVLELYRFRWQIEIAFKRLKSILDLNEIPTKDPTTTQAFLLTKILGALLIEDMTERYVSFSPWGYRLEGPLSFHLAAPSNST